MADNNRNQRTTKWQSGFPKKSQQGNQGQHSGGQSLRDTADARSQGVSDTQNHDVPMAEFEGDFEESGNEEREGSQGENSNANQSGRRRDNS